MADLLGQVSPLAKNRKKTVQTSHVRKHMFRRPETTRARQLPRMRACLYFGSPPEYRKCGSVVNGRLRHREKNRLPREFQSDSFHDAKAERRDDTVHRITNRDHVLLWLSRKMCSSEWNSLCTLNEIYAKYCAKKKTFQNVMALVAWSRYTTVRHSTIETSGPPQEVSRRVCSHTNTTAPSSPTLRCVTSSLPRLACFLAFLSKLSNAQTVKNSNSVNRPGCPSIMDTPVMKCTYLQDYFTDFLIQCSNIQIGSPPSHYKEFAERPNTLSRSQSSTDRLFVIVIARNLPRPPVPSLIMNEFLEPHSYFSPCRERAPSVDSGSHSRQIPW